MTPDRLRQRRTTRFHARRAADELLIEAIFGDILLARLTRPAAPPETPVVTPALDAVLR